MSSNENKKLNFKSYRLVTQIVQTYLAFLSEEKALNRVAITIYITLT